MELRPAFAGHPAFDATYYAGWVNGPDDAATTTDPMAAVRFAREADARTVARKLGHTLSCTWQAIEHGFAAPAPVAATLPSFSPVATVDLQSSGPGDKLKWTSQQGCLPHGTVLYAKKK